MGSELQEVPCRCPPPHIHLGWTLGDLPGLPDDGQRYELVDGGLHVTEPLAVSVVPASLID